LIIHDIAAMSFSRLPFRRREERDIQNRRKISLTKTYNKDRTRGLLFLNIKFPLATSGSDLRHLMI